MITGSVVGAATSLEMTHVGIVGYIVPESPGSHCEGHSSALGKNCL